MLKIWDNIILLVYKELVVYFFSKKYIIYYKVNYFFIKNKIPWNPCGDPRSPFKAGIGEEKNPH